MRIFRLIFPLFLIGLATPANAQQKLTVHKLEDIVIYRDDKFYSSFPSIVCRPDGELIVAFRRAPDRRPFGEPRSHPPELGSFQERAT